MTSTRPLSSAGSFRARTFPSWRRWAWQACSRRVPRPMRSSPSFETLSLAHRQPSRPDPRGASKAQRAHRAHEELRVLSPVHVGNVDVQLDLVAVRIHDVEAVGDGVFAGAHNGNP